MLQAHLSMKLLFRFCSEPEAAKPSAPLGGGAFLKINEIHLLLTFISPYFPTFSFSLYMCMKQKHLYYKYYSNSCTYPPVVK